MINLELFLAMKKILKKFLNFYIRSFILIFFVRFVLGRVCGMNFDFLEPASMIPFFQTKVVKPTAEFGFAARDIYMEHAEIIETLFNVAVRLVILSLLVLTGQLMTDFTTFFRLFVRFLNFVGAINLLRLQVSIIVVRFAGIERIGYVLWFLVIGCYLTGLEYVKFIIFQQDAIQRMLNITI
ncbi:hypothetical protein LSTR_LSTR008153 [Laodelphax striatellus]|uniref:Uncharacterized protein n=1 Tax=Laodelphax striatellus TaxID=195883 RepID=A0A482WZ77_LAOST|nr:hypothetical protein LSTR_LSTR008153 [Laodelphax striatellus]